MSKRMSASILAACIKRGFGLGRMDRYKPWLRIRRRMSSAVSKQVFCNLALRPTNHHLLSGLEYKTALLNAWLGPRELRECLPLWPDPHPHPQAGIYCETNPRLDDSPGLLEIAKAAGIEHGVFFGTNIPYVATNDLTFWVPTSVHLTRQLVFISCKPKIEIECKPRVRERLELERRYALANGGIHRIETGEKLPLKLIDNLDWLLPLNKEVSQLRNSSKHKDFCALVMYRAKHIPLGSAIEASRVALNLSKQEGFQYFRVGVWIHSIDIDLNFPVVMSKPMHFDSGKTVLHWRNHYWSHHGEKA